MLCVYYNYIINNYIISNDIINRYDGCVWNVSVGRYNRKDPANLAISDLASALHLHLKTRRLLRRKKKFHDRVAPSQGPQSSVSFIVVGRGCMLSLSFRRLLSLALSLSLHVVIAPVCTSHHGLIVLSEEDISSFRGEQTARRVHVYWRPYRNCEDVLET